MTWGKGFWKTVLVNASRGQFGITYHHKLKPCALLCVWYILEKTVAFSFATIMATEILWNVIRFFCQSITFLGANKERIIASDLIRVLSWDLQRGSNFDFVGFSFDFLPFNFLKFSYQTLLILCSRYSHHPSCSHSLLSPPHWFKP